MKTPGQEKKRIKFNADIMHVSQRSNSKDNQHNNPTSARRIKTAKSHHQSIDFKVTKIIERPQEENLTTNFSPESPKKTTRTDKIENNRSPDSLYKLQTNVTKPKDYKPLKGRNDVAILQSTPTSQLFKTSERNGSYNKSQYNTKEQSINLKKNSINNSNLSGSFAGNLPSQRSPMSRNANGGHKKNLSVSNKISIKF